MSAAATHVVLAIDGGNTKTDVALVGGDGHLLSLIRGGTSSPHLLGFARAVELLGQLVAEAVVAASSPCERVAPTESGGARGDGTGQRAGAGGRRVADIAHVLLAGADLPEEVELLERSLGELGWTPQLVVENDTLALLRTGTDRGWGVAVVCGGGINAVGVAPDGRMARFPSLGAITGDWGGGHDVGLEALSVAARSADGRGPRTSLERAVPEHLGMRTPLDVARAIHFKQLTVEELAELTPLVYEQAAHDAVAHGILERLGDEVVAMARAALTRLQLCDSDAEVVIGGGLMRAAPDWMVERIRCGMHAVAPAATLVVAHEAPIVGAAMLGLDAIAAEPSAISRARGELQQAVAELSRQLVG